MTKNVDVKKFESNGEVFEIGSYHGISILIRKSDGYINATKLCSQFDTKNGNSKEFRQLLRTDDWKEYFEEFCTEYSSSDEKNVFVGIPTNAYFIDNQMKSYSNELRGYYIHPKLINYVSFWASPKYAVYVSKIMDLLNERIRITNEAQTELIDNLEKEVSNLKRKLDLKTKIIQDQDDYIEKQEMKIEDNLKLIKSQEQQIANNLQTIALKSVRVDEQVERDLYIYQVTDDIYQMCANSHQRPPNVLNHWEFPSAMHVKKEAAKILDIKYPYLFNKVMHDAVCHVILGFKPLVIHDPNVKPDRKCSPKKIESIKQKDNRLLILELNYKNADGSDNLADNNNFYPFKIIEDNTCSYKELCKRFNAKYVFKAWLFPGEISVKKLLNKFNYKNYLNYDDIAPVLEYIQSLNPKKILK